MKIFTKPVPFRPTPAVSNLDDGKGILYFSSSKEDGTLLAHIAGDPFPDYPREEIEGFRVLNGEPLKEGYQVVGTFGEGEVENYAAHLVYATPFYKDGFLLNTLASSKADGKETIDLWILKEYASKLNAIPKNALAPSAPSETFWEYATKDAESAKFSISDYFLNENTDYDDGETRDRCSLVFGPEGSGYSTFAFFSNTEEGPRFLNSDIVYFDHAGEECLFVFPPELVSRIPNAMGRRAIFLTIMSAYEKGRSDENQRCKELLASTLSQLKR